MTKILTADELLEYVKENGVTKCKLTLQYNAIPVNTILYFGLHNGNNHISTFKIATYNKNLQFNYNFDYSWISAWHRQYTGKFEILDDDNVSDFQWAVKQLKQGKKVRRKRWNNNRYMILNEDNIIMHSSGTELRMWIGVLDATDWEIFKEEKTFGKWWVTPEGEIKYRSGLGPKTVKEVDNLQEAINESKRIRGEDEEADPEKYY